MAQTSVTETPCTCGYLERAAHDPDLPVQFDVRVGEYQFWYQVPGDEMPSYLVIYHCPACGGAAPKSLRGSLFHIVPQAERSRVFALLEPIRTLSDALERLGKPDEDCAYGTVIRHHEEGNRPPVDEFCRTYRYHSLSKVAQVEITEHRDGTVSFGLSGKQKG
jgi:hypothetical protein